MEKSCLFIPGILYPGGPLGAGEGDICAVEFGLSKPENTGVDGDGDGGGGFSLFHNSEQLVFQKPILSFSRS